VDEPRQSTEDKQLLERVIKVLNTWEPYHKRWGKKADHYYSLYRNYQNWQTALSESNSPNGRDAIFRDGQTEFGPELFIPMCFSTVETIVPAMLANPPSLDGIRPRTPASDSNVANVKAMLESQHEQIDYELKLQTVAKDGLIYGTGVQKCYWRKDWRKRRVLVNSVLPGGGLVPQEMWKLVFDDPDADAVDPKDFIADPFAAEIAVAEGAFHRTWRSNRYVERMIGSEQWRNLTGLSGDQLAALANDKKYDEVWNERNTARSQPQRQTGTTPAGGTGAKIIHEVLEFHDGEQVVTILDRQVVVASGPNPNWHGELPFQVFRPTQVTHELHGIGEIEPIERLQEELNTLRTQRRYNADLVLQRVFAYHEGLVDRNDIKFGPGYAIGVNGDPRELLFPIQVGDIPHSGYEEEDRIGADIDRTSGISDVIAGAGMQGGGDTATGVQLVQNAASRRIENKTRRLELEVINPGARQFVLLDQQRILTDRDVRIPVQPTPGEPDRRWAWIQVGPQELMGEFDIRTDRGSTQPENIPQNRADAQMAMTLFGQSASVDQQKLAEWSIGKLGVPRPEEWIAPPNPTVPAEVLDRLAEQGVPREQIIEALAQAGGPDLLGGAAGANPAGQPGGEPQGPSAPPPTEPIGEKP